MCGAFSWLVLVVIASVVRAEGNIGCLFAEGLCVEELEWCYNDLVFGRCLPKYGHIDEDELHRYPLVGAEVAALTARIASLQSQGYDWRDDYTQCQLQDILWYLRRGTLSHPCRQLRLEKDHEISPAKDDLAYVRFTPSSREPNGIYADEVYFSPGRSDKRRRRKKNNRNVFDFVSPQISSIETSGALQIDNDYESSDNNIYQYIPDLPDNIQIAPLVTNKQIQDDPELIGEREMQPSSGRKLDTHARWFENKNPRYLDYPFETLLEFAVKSQGLDQQKIDNYSQLDTTDQDKQVNDRNMQKKIAGIYTEGGLLYVQDTNDENKEVSKSDLLSVLAGNSRLGFKRRERLDVKKPGPPLPNDEALGKPYKSISLIALDTTIPVQKKENAKYHVPHSVDTSYAYVTVKDSIKSWRVGARIMQILIEILKLPPGSLSHPRIDSHEVSFLVEETTRLNASILAQKIMNESIINGLEHQYGIIVTGAGVGDKAKLPVQKQLLVPDDNPFHGNMAGFLFGGIGGAILVAFAAIFLIKKHSRAKDKLTALEGRECESSKDYQELCRARMAAKNPSVPEPLIQPQAIIGSSRIAPLSKDSDQNSPTSRSSTSSWSEEPALTNMDISTGHMVLSYMEDHLRNKNRLDREWGALCRYEAEPGARSAASAETSLPLNRPSAPLPYDHSRVVLNHLSNEAGLDYINASTISDHDPRAPLYVAAQGPVKETASHFWQMVWEQGAVVIVMLCKLEEDEVEMCYQYWPQEGYHVYHIYEVHLVSEHIWCEDYLVRSFYLKNLRTGETRTVTQFHYLSWPKSGLPSSSKTLLEFRRKVNKSYRGRSCPIIVHCSDGAGRSGTYILLDMVLARMAKGVREIDIAATLEHIRDQRADMVATRAQFEFVLTAVAEEVHAILKALPANFPEKNDKNKEKETSTKEVAPANKSEEKPQNILETIAQEYN